ncbi:MAG: dihydrodipicolinate synthase family protein [Phycisphaerae bacterium]|nr:dihydrodipicolinate synthase family protein [Phycisphaerae bacterium]
MNSRMAKARITGGVFAPIVTPFDADEQVDLSAFRAIVEYLAASGITGLLVTGTTSEAYTLDLDDRRKLYEAAIRQANGRLQILAGAGAVTTREAERFTALAADCGCDAACILTPWFQTPSPLGLERYLGDIADHVKGRIPLLFYHNPARTGLNWPTEHIAELANKFSGAYIGIKESSQSTDRVAAVRKLVRPEFLIYSGNAHMQPVFAPAGANGTIDPLVNALPAEALRAAGGDQGMVKTYGAIAATLAKSTNLIATLKRLMVSLGLPAGRARRPHDAVDPAQYDALAAAVAATGRMTAARGDGTSESHAATSGKLPPVHVITPEVLDEGLRRPPAKASHVTLYRAVEDGFGYNHHAAITVFGGRYFAAWSAGRMNEDNPGQIVQFATSGDGVTWSAPQPVMPTPEGKNRWTNAGFWARGGELYLLATRCTRARYVEGELVPGRCWEDLATDAFQWQGGAWRHVGLALDGFYANESPRLAPGRSDGAWLWPGVDAQHSAVMAIGGRDGIGDWRKVILAPRSDGWKLSEPSWFRTGCRAIRTLMRDDGGSRRLFVSDSRDGGEHWTSPLPTDLPDAQSKFHALAVNDGIAQRVALVCNPTADDTRRRLLAVVLSPDGLTFNRAVTLQHDPSARARLGGMHKAGGFQYPNATVAAGRLWVVYSANKEDIQLSSVLLSELA